MIHSTLKQRTRSFHEALETKLCFLLSDELSLERYAAVQKKFYGFYRPIEARLFAILGSDDPELNLQQRLKLFLCNK